ILDVQLPDGSGIDLLRQIRETPKLSATPVILLSTLAEVANRIEGLTTGADEYIGKPCDTAYLLQRLWQVITLQEQPAPPGGGGGKLLVVDDSPTYLSVITDALRRDGHEVVHAHCGAEALFYLEVEPVDCVLLDLHLPDLSGVEVCQRLRSIPGREDTPVLMVTASDSQSSRARALAAGIDALVIKSPDMDELCAHVRGVLSRRRPEEPVPPPPASNRRGVSLLQQVIAASGLSPTIARGALERACRRAGVDARTMTPTDLQRALPAIHETLRTFLPALQADERARAMAALARVATRAGG
ncbi:MAG TPA: response regulator, partial [Candidatus Nanopelagicales bacterium]|nr:response regulator [Candidatus Nanopelagicales bacterium]